LTAICCWCDTRPSPGEQPLQLRVENLTLLPNSQPMLHVRALNSGNQEFRGTVQIVVPESWRMESRQKEIVLEPGESTRLAFSVNAGSESATNCYPIRVTAAAGGQQIIHEQNMVVASAPYFKPTVDGDPQDWKDAIPIQFIADGKRTTISTYWNRRKFSLLVEVQEDALITASPGTRFDAVQFALSPAESETSRSPSGTANRFEYLLVAVDEQTAEGYRLAQPGTPYAELAGERSLNRLVDNTMEVAVTRRQGTTIYECSVPFAALRSAIRPSEGREFLFSVLIHDPDGTGLRDWGEAAGLWESDRNPLAWSRWEGAKWPAKPPMDCRTQWGMCSSRY
jgi:hypothetical protein